MAQKLQPRKKYRFTQIEKDTKIFELVMKKSKLKFNHLIQNTINGFVFVIAYINFCGFGL